ncbi:Carbonic anhydrase [Leucoagaricus sp. SymC.cos]|nr:Carbonic anhydrase [Leucoagaricus sp. SymC.cos]
MRLIDSTASVPSSMFIGCSDSRVSEGTVFNAQPGTLFTERNIANQFHTTDPNTHAVLAYAVAELGVKHVIVMGHYGCGGVAAAIASPPAASIDAANGVVQDWIKPIRELFQSSNRPEIVELRDRLGNQTVVEEPDISEPGFRALVEENVKAGVKRIATDSVIVNHYATLGTNATLTTKRAESNDPPGDIFIHGWVYDIANGEIHDLGVSVGPPGKPVPAAPFPAVANAAISTARKHSSNSTEGNTTEGSGGHDGEVSKRCEQICQAKRFFSRFSA